MISLFENGLLRGAAAIIFALLFGCAVNQGCLEKKNLQPVVIFEGHNGQTTRVNVELVSNDEDRARGLMFRRHLRPDAGMLFVYRFEDNHAFWMKNTYIPLDMIFIGANMRVVGLARKTRPLTLQRIRVEMPSMFILEVNAGYAAAHGICEGTHVSFEGIETNY
ncbi:MAG TPA: DUF192 domain-containing protein [Myxococcota bacterium]|nr:DUF192 domain-containing protein [Myxococcota bacterium]